MTRFVWRSIRRLLFPNTTQSISLVEFSGKHPKDAVKVRLLDNYNGTTERNRPSTRYVNFER